MKLRTQLALLRPWQLAFFLCIGLSVVGLAWFLPVGLAFWADSILSGPGLLLIAFLSAVAWLIYAGSVRRHHLRADLCESFLGQL